MFQIFCVNCNPSWRDTISNQRNSIGSFDITWGCGIPRWTNFIVSYKTINRALWIIPRSLCQPVPKCIHTGAWRSDHMCYVWESWSKCLIKEANLCTCFRDVEGTKEQNIQKRSLHSHWTVHQHEEIWRVLCVLDTKFCIQSAYFILHITIKYHCFFYISSYLLMVDFSKVR